MGTTFIFAFSVIHKSTFVLSGTIQCLSMSGIINKKPHLSILLVTIISISVKIVIHWFGNTKLIQMSPATEVLEENWICLLNELVL